jgi:regulatory protein
MKITYNNKKIKNIEYYEVYTDGHFAFNVPNELFLALSIYDKNELEVDEIERIKNITLTNNAKSVALKSLTIKMTSRKEAFDKLIEKGFDKDVAEAALNSLASLGYINDKMYAMKYISDRLRLKPKSKKLIKFELVSKGVDQKVADEILSEWSVDEEAVAEGLLRKKFGKYNLSEPSVNKKMYSFLQHRGYDYELILRLIEKVKENQ